MKPILHQPEQHEKHLERIDALFTRLFERERTSIATLIQLIPSVDVLVHERAKLTYSIHTCLWLNVYSNNTPKHTYDYQRHIHNLPRESFSGTEK